MAMSDITLPISVIPTVPRGATHECPGSYAAKVEIIRGHIQPSARMRLQSGETVYGVICCPFCGDRVGR